jgi:uncharacterized protein with PIN domain
MDCNGIIEKVDKTEVVHLLQQNTRKAFNDFYQCSSCRKVYWEGSHWKRMAERVKLAVDS